MAEADLLIKVASSPKDPFKDINDSLDDTDKKVGGLSSGFVKMAGAIGGIAALGSAFTFILDATREMEDLKTQFIAFTGSAAGAADQMERLTQFASQSPFALAQVAEANRTLLAFGSSTAESIEQLRALGEVSAATGSDLKDLATIFGQIQAEGKLTGERFNQLIERGVNIGPELARSLGIAETSVKKFVSEGKVGADVVEAAFQKMTSAGGQFFGSTGRMAETVSGSLSTLNDNVSILASTIGSSAVPGLTSLVNIISKAVEGNIAYLKEQQKIANENEAQKRIRAIGEEVSTLDEKLKDLKKNQSEGFKFFGDDQLELTDKIDQVTLAITRLSQERLKLVKQEGLAESFKKDAEAAVENQKKIDKADQEALGKKQEADAARAADEEKVRQDRLKKIADSEKQISDLIKQEQAARAVTEQTLTAQFIAQKQEIEGTALAEQNELTRQKVVDAAIQREAEVTSARLQAEAARQDLLGQYENAEVIRQQDAQKKITDSQKKGEAERIAILKKAQKDEFDLEKVTSDAKKNFDEQTYAQRVATAQAGLNALAQLTRSKSREAFELGKAAATAQALVAIPTTAIEAYKSLAGIPIIGPGLGAVAAAAAISSGMEQVRNIQNTRIAFAKGGLVPGTGNKDTVPALLTPGEVVVPKQNFADLQDSFVRDAIGQDQIMLLQASNNIQAKILEQITYGVINDKLTQMISILDTIKLNSFSTGGSSTTPTIAIPEVTVETVKEINKEINRNRPEDIVVKGDRTRGPSRASTT